MASAAGRRRPDGDEAAQDKHDMRSFGIICEVRIDHRSGRALNARMEIVDPMMTALRTSLAISGALASASASLVIGFNGAERELARTSPSPRG
jgi:hypothetical protein